MASLYERKSSRIWFETELFKQIQFQISQRFNINNDHLYRIIENLISKKRHRSQLFKVKQNVQAVVDCEHHVRILKLDGLIIIDENQSSLEELCIKIKETV